MCAGLAFFRPQCSVPLGLGGVECDGRPVRRGTCGPGQPGASAALCLVVFLLGGFPWLMELLEKRSSVILFLMDTHVCPFCFHVCFLMSLVFCLII